MKRIALFITLTLILLTGLLGPAAAVSAQPSEMTKVLIAFDRQPSPNEEAIVRGVGGNIKYTYELVPAIAASVPEAAIQGLLRNPRIIRIEPDVKVYAIDAELDNTWGVKRIGAGIVHDGGNKGAGVKVAVIDSGVDYTHPDLDANYAGGYDFVNGDSNPMDDNGHGTHVAGTIAAEDDNTGVVGVAPSAKIYALKVLGADGGGNYSDIIAALQWSVNNGIQVTNNSYGSSGDPGATVKAAFDNAYAAGIFHVGAAGNSGNPRGSGDNVIYPARWASVVAVSATDSSDKRASWSSTGPDVELAAPGVSIKSTLSGGGYGNMSGTSMASPHVAGVAALVIASGVTGNENVRQMLISTADDLGAVGKDNLFGYGLVDADGAAPAPVVNRAPVANAGTDQTVKTGSTVSLNGSASSDPDGDTITYNWEFVSMPSGSSPSMSGATTVTASFVADADGTYEVKLTVSDGLLSSSDSVLVTAMANRAPIANAGTDQSVNTGSTVQLNGTASSDPDGDTISYNWVLTLKPGDSTATLNGANTATPTFVADVDGSYQIDLTVSDGILSASDTVVVTAATVATATQVSVVSPSGADGYYTEGGRDGKAHLRIIVALVDNLGNPVGGASVSTDVYLNGSRYTSGTGTTGTDGKVIFKLNAAPSGTYTTTVTKVMVAGLTWVGGTPENSYTK